MWGLSLLCFFVEGEGEDVCLARGGCALLALC